MNGYLIYEIAAALSLIMLPESEKFYSEYELRILMASNGSVYKIAVAFEAIDPKENEYFGNTHKVIMRQDVQSIQEKFITTLSYPPIDDINRLVPDAETCMNCVLFNRNYYKGLEGRREIDIINRGAIDCVLQETEEIYKVWNLFVEVRRGYYYVPHRRSLLNEIRSTIGDVNYYSGTIPPCVPIWRIPER